MQHRADIDCASDPNTFFPQNWLLERWHSSICQQTWFAWKISSPVFWQCDWVSIVSCYWPKAWVSNGKPKWRNALLSKGWYYVSPNRIRQNIHTADVGSRWTEFIYSASKDNCQTIIDRVVINENYDVQRPIIWQSIATSAHLIKNSSIT